MNAPYQELEKIIGYHFENPEYLERALTHRSFRYENKEIEKDNQRLEFLGDAVLSLLAAAHLFKRFPNMQEGELTRIRASLANGRTLAKLGEQWNLGTYLRLGKGETQSGGCDRPSNLTDGLEAILGALYLDGGMNVVAQVFEAHFIQELDLILETTWSENPKGALQELAQHTWKVSPKYHIIQETGPAHDKIFTSEVTINGESYGTGTGQSKQISEILAARAAMEKLTKEETPG